MVKNFMMLAQVALIVYFQIYPKQFNAFIACGATQLIGKTNDREFALRATSINAREFHLASDAEMAARP